MRNIQTHVNTPEHDPSRSTAVRIYSRQDEFSRGVQSMQRNGWALRTFSQVRSPQAHDLIRASVPGYIPFDAQQQIVAHFVCATARSATTTGRQQLRRRLANSLVQLAGWLDNPDTGRATERCTPTA